MTDNELLIEIRDLLAEILNSVSGGYSQVTGNQQTVFDTMTVLRSTDQRSKAVVVTNLQDQLVEISEGELVIGIISLNQSLRAPLNGTGVITARVMTAGQTSLIATTTYLR